MYMFIIDVIFQTCFTSQPQISWPMANTKVIPKEAYNSKRMQSAV